MATKSRKMIHMVPSPKHTFIQLHTTRRGSCVGRIESSLPAFDRSSDVHPKLPRNPSSDDLFLGVSNSLPRKPCRAPSPTRQDITDKKEISDSSESESPRTVRDVQEFTQDAIDIYEYEDMGLPSGESLASSRLCAKNSRRRGSSHSRLEDHLMDRPEKQSGNIRDYVGTKASKNTSQRSTRTTDSNGSKSRSSQHRRKSALGSQDSSMDSDNDTLDVECKYEVKVTQNRSGNHQSQPKTSGASDHQRTRHNHLNVYCIEETQSNTKHEYKESEDSQRSSRSATCDPSKDGRVVHSASSSSHNVSRRRGSALARLELKDEDASSNRAEGKGNRRSSIATLRPILRRSSITSASGSGRSSRRSSIDSSSSSSSHHHRSKKEGRKGTSSRRSSIESSLQSSHNDTSTVSRSNRPPINKRPPSTLKASNLLQTMGRRGSTGSSNYLESIIPRTTAYNGVPRSTELDQTLDRLTHGARRKLERSSSMLSRSSKSSAGVSIGSTSLNSMERYTVPWWK